jgi:hypothetical protein
MNICAVANAALYAAFSIVALAATALVAPSAQAQSTELQLSRAQVRAELQRARQSGELDAAQAQMYSSSLAQARTAQRRANDEESITPKGVDRKEVVADVMRARAKGELGRVSAQP